MAIASAALMGSAMPTDNMPPNTVKLSAMMRELSAKPGFTEAFLKELEGGSKRKSGTALLTPDLVNHLRELIVGKDWDGIDRFPGWTMGEITPAVGALAHAAADKASPQYKDQKSIYLDVGPYSLDNNGIPIDFRVPSPLPGFSLEDNVTALGDGVTRGDGPSELAPEHAESQRLADALNRLSANGLDGVPHANATWNDRRIASTPEELIAVIMQSGQTVTVTDSRFFANFGHLHFNGQDVMTPFWVDSQIVVPARPGRAEGPLLIPVSHAEYEWHIRGPHLNADISFYFGIDGKAQFRTMDELDQTWVMKRDAHEYRQTDAVEVTRLAGAVLRAYMRLHQAHPSTPFNGYYAFGVCQDVVAAIELKMTGAATLFPNTADDSLFTDSRDAEINALIKRLPKDRGGEPPEIERIFASLPVGTTDAELGSVTIPGLGADLVAVHDATVAGKIRRTDSFWRHRIRQGVGVFAILTVLWFGWRWVRRSNRRRAIGNP
jgi:hypothetical protein